MPFYPTDIAPWAHDTIELMPTGKICGGGGKSRPWPRGFVQFPIDKDGKLNLLRLSFDDGHVYEFRRE
jgi:hypothetical protein